MVDNRILETALRLAEDGFAVFPLKPGAKVPLTKNGVKDATTDPRQIEAWWAKTPGANLGLSAAGLVILDLDPAKDGSSNPWPQDPSQRADLGNTPTQATPRGGTHHLFRLPAGKSFKNSAGKLAPGVDVRTDGGYIVLSPSILEPTKSHPGGAYCLVGRYFLPHPASLPEPPGWLIEALEDAESPKVFKLESIHPRAVSSVPADRRVERARAWLLHADVAIDGQGGHNTTYRVVVALFEKFDLTQDQAWEALQDWNSRCLGPWSEKDLWHKIRSADEHYKGPRGTYLVDTLEPLDLQRLAGLDEAIAKATPGATTQGSGFPIHCLPGSMRFFVDAVCRALQVDPAFVAVPALTAAAGAIGATRSISLKQGWTEPAVLWTGVIAPSGSTKTPAMRQVLRPFWAVHEAKQAEYREAYAAYETALEKFERSSKKDQSEAAKMLRVAPAPPKQERVILADVTIQKLAEVLSDNSRGTFCAVDELAGWFSNLTRYAQSGSSDLPQWLSLHSGEPLIVDRKSSPIPVYVPRPLVSLTGGIQPGILAKNFTPEMVDSGAAARFLFAIPPVHYADWTEDEISEDTARIWADLVGRLLTLQGDFELEGHLAPLVLELEPEAKREYIAFYNTVSKRMASQGISQDDENSFLSKMRGQAARLALVLAMVDRAEKNELESRQPIPGAWMRAGVEIAWWFADQRRKMKAQFWATKTAKPTLKDRILGHLKEAGLAGLSKTDISSKLGRNFPSEAITGALVELQNQGLALVETTPTGGRELEIWRTP